MTRGRASQGPAVAGEGERVPDGAGDIHALMDGLREEMVAVLEREFARAESMVAKRMAERLESADALIARLSEENARMMAELAKSESTLARFRELAASAP